MTETEDIIHDILNNKNSKEFFKDKYTEFASNCPHLFDKLFEKDLDRVTLNYMLNQKQKMEANKLSEHDASVKVGTLLVDKYVKPNLS